jgi:diguanylate cyclase (GGDEF)-like protein
VKVAPDQAAKVLSIVAASSAAGDRTAYAIERQGYLDALPLPAAIVRPSKQTLNIVASNVAFGKLAVSEDERQDLLDRVEASVAVRQVLSGTSEGAQFEWQDASVVDGRHYTVTISPVVSPSQIGRQVLVTLIERTGEVRAGESLRRESRTDPLTGLSNRAGFVEVLERRIAELGADRFALVMVDLARFSRVNECMGSLGADELIITVARRMLSQLRGTDLLARTGSNEFSIAVRLDDGPGDVLAAARRVEIALTQPFRLSDFEIKVDCAIGWALATGGDNPDDAETFMRHAQHALYRAKQTKQIEQYQLSAMNVARRRFTMETELRRALERDELTLAFQPLVSLETGKITGFEALSRWVLPDNELVAPAEFIAVAEDCGLILPLGRWALDRALKTMVAWDAAAGFELPLYMSVNLSPIQMARDDVAQDVADALRTHRVAGHRLSLELTEGVIVSDPVRAGRTLEALKACDAQVAMDDFGTGFSNLASLQMLPIDVLKIDRSFVTDMLGDTDRIAIVRAILSLAHALKMKITAEGVETPELAGALAALGCTTGQGYHFGRPMVADAALAYAITSLG